MTFGLQNLLGIVALRSRGRKKAISVEYDRHHGAARPVAVVVVRIAGEDDVAAIVGARQRGTDARNGIVAASGASIDMGTAEADRSIRTASGCDDDASVACRTTGGGTHRNPAGGVDTAARAGIAGTPRAEISGWDDHIARLRHLIDDRADRTDNCGESVDGRAEIGRASCRERVYGRV